MKTSKKITAKYDRRQASYQQTLNSLPPNKQRAYKRPGSRNPKKAGGK